jgi:hypothetical protein
LSSIKKKVPSGFFFVFFVKKKDNMTDVRRELADLRRVLNPPTPNPEVPMPNVANFAAPAPGVPPASVSTFKPCKLIKWIVGIVIGCFAIYMLVLRKKLIAMKTPHPQPIANREPQAFAPAQQPAAPPQPAQPLPPASSPDPNFVRF